MKGEMKGGKKDSIIKKNIKEKMKRNLKWVVERHGCGR